MSDVSEVRPGRVSFATLWTHFVGDDGGPFLQFCAAQRTDLKCFLREGRRAAVQGPRFRPLFPSRPSPAAPC